MSVIIKGMKMPRSCEYCRFSGIGGLRNERVVCMFTGANAYMNTVQYLDDCPLIEVPTPHGRLIDADELLEHAWREKLDSRELIAKMIDDAPTVIPAEDGDGDV